MAVSQNTIALIFDYDQTLSPSYMQDDVLFPEFGIDSSSFWKKCNTLVLEREWDSELAYMHCLLEYLQLDGVSNQKLRDLGKNLHYFPGVSTFFDELIASTLRPEHKAQDIRIEYYIVSSGLKALLDGCSIAPHFKAIYGCEFAEDKHGTISYPKRTISHTTKTQYLFRINKGLLDYNDDVNDHLPPTARPIPFDNMIYVGDGPTDVPCFTVMRKSGGQAIAVYNPKDSSRKSFQKCYQLCAKADRVRHIAPANYKEGSHLRLLLEEMVSSVANRILNQRHLDSIDQRVSAPHF